MEFFLIPDYEAHYYADLLKAIHGYLRPKRYFEIGTAAGDTLALAECASLAIDPNFEIKRDVMRGKPNCSMYQMTSDDFFSRFDPKLLLGGTIDFAFLDGMHLFEYLLRDFINTERSVSRNSVVMLHDCLPTDSFVARRDVNDRSLSNLSPHQDWWAGDVWKTVAILLKYRPDLVIYGCKAIPTGLVAITNLDPSSQILSETYFHIIKEYHDDSNIFENIKNYFESVTMIEPEELLSHERLARRFWL